MDKIPDINFKNDPLIKKVSRFLLIFQGCAFFIGIIFAGFHINALVLFIAFVSIVIFIGAIIWLNIRYKTNPIIKKRTNLNLKAASIKAQIQVHSTNIHLTHTAKEQLQKDEHNELDVALKNLQRSFVLTGLSNALILNATIPGIGPKLKERLIANGITNAARVDNRIDSIQGFGEAKLIEIKNWRNMILTELNYNIPKEIPIPQSEAIKKKFEAHHANNEAQKQKLQESKTKFENDLAQIQPRIIELSPFTFKYYFQKSIGSQGKLGIFSSVLLLISQICLGSNATAAAIVSSIPTATSTPTITSTPTATFTATITLTSTITNTPTITLTPTITFTPTITNTPYVFSTFTLLPYIPPVFTPTLNRTNCDPSYPTVCIPPPPPDLNCSDIPYRNFIVLPPDPHNFDGNHDGIGCQT